MLMSNQNVAEHLATRETSRKISKQVVPTQNVEIKKNYIVVFVHHPFSRNLSTIENLGSILNHLETLGKLWRLFEPHFYVFIQ